MSMLCRLSCLCLALLAAFAVAASEYLTYPLHQRGVNPQTYAVELLRLALEKGGGDYLLQASPQPMSPSRARYSLEHNDNQVQVIWTMTTREREATLLPIRIPIYKGLIGWRIPLIRGDQRELLANISDRAALATLRIGQRSDWPDTAILRANGQQVEVSPAYPGLFDMLAAKRFDLFPLEAVMVQQEQQRVSAEGLNIAIDKHLVLHYPSALYYFTSRQRPELAETIRRGLEAAITDGSFERLFQSYFALTLKQLHLPQRRVIELDNPLLPDTLPLDRPELWYHP
ncbi:transporter substrate-binding domain-containing protein [Pseudomonas sp. LS44]|uniref:substrate-binding periplasmic protein n=1 Tax=Pseudomonas sp. LS44 TaxID=1357074 RepID=UPI00215A2F0D|nr:transporter substrate-binding domain-containing protein [Pseudomonas sp. LS44]UVE16277.1 transporter substrate-binding domain-containing protein [Pseudomonas sp. LS44]